MDVGMLRNYTEIAHSTLLKLDTDINHNLGNYTDSADDTFLLVINIFMRIRRC